MDEDKQGQFHLAAPIDHGEDENGPFDVVPLSMVKGGELKPFKVHKKPMKHIINASDPAPRGWYKNKHEPSRVRPRPCYTEAMLTTPYGGFCPVGCRMCYVDNGTRGYRATGLATANPGYPAFMRKKIEQMYLAPAAYMSSFTEPFQLLESNYHVVQDLSQVFVDHNIPLFYLSRLIPPEWAKDMLLSNPYSYMQWSVNDSRTSVYKRISPGSYTIEQVLAAVEDFTAAGIYTSFQCNPVLPGITPIEAIVDLIHMAAKAGLKHIIFKFAEQVFNNRQLLLKRLSDGRVPDVDKFDAVFHQTIGGVYTVNQDLRLEWLNVFLEETRKAEITMSLCYEYYDDGHAGANLAPYFTTSDQCHGRGVPIHYREDLDYQFQALPGCYRKGCLYCEEHGTHACGNSKLLEASALTYKDYKDIRLTGEEDNWHLVESCLEPEVARTKLVTGNPGYRTDIDWWDFEIS